MILTFNYNGKFRKVGVVKLDDKVIQGISLGDIPEDSEGYSSLINYFQSIPCSFIEDNENKVMKPFVDISDRRDFDLKPFYSYFRKFVSDKISREDIKNILVNQISNYSEEKEKNKIKGEGKKEEKPTKKIWKFEDGSEAVIETKVETK